MAWAVRLSFVVSQDHEVHLTRCRCAQHISSWTNYSWGPLIVSGDPVNLVPPFAPAHTKIDILSKPEVSCSKSSCFCPSTCRGRPRWFAGLGTSTLKMSNTKWEPLHATQHNSGVHQNSHSSSEALNKNSGFHSLILQMGKPFIIHGEPRCLFPDPKPGCTS